MFLTPKPAIFPEHPEDGPVIGALFGSNIFCFLCHLWFDPPSAGEATRGYLHGGLAMDFIGQKGPTSRTHLLLLDALVVALQLVHLAAGMVRRRLRGSSESETAGQTETATQNTTQDLDSEERGVRRSDEQQDIEMQSLNPSGSTEPAPTTMADEFSEQDALLANTAPRTDAHIFDAFHSGQIVLADLDIWKRIKEQAKMMKHARHARTDRAGGLAGQTFRTELAARMLRMRIGTDALRESL